MERKKLKNYLPTLSIIYKVHMIYYDDSNLWYNH